MCGTSDGTAFPSPDFKCPASTAPPVGYLWPDRVIAAPGTSAYPPPEVYQPPAAQVMTTTGENMLVRSVARPLSASAFIAATPAHAATRTFRDPADNVVGAARACEGDIRGVTINHTLRTVVIVIQGGVDDGLAVYLDARPKNAGHEFNLSWEGCFSEALSVLCVDFFDDDATSLACAATERSLVTPTTGAPPALWCPAHA